MKAFEYARSSGLDVVSVCPTLVLGPMMQSTVNSSSMVLLKLLKGSFCISLPTHICNSVAFFMIISLFQWITLQLVNKLFYS